MKRSEIDFKAKFNSFLDTLTERQNTVQTVRVILCGGGSFVIAELADESERVRRWCLYVVHKSGLKLFGSLVFGKF